MPVAARGLPGMPGPPPPPDDADGRGLPQPPREAAPAPAPQQQSTAPVVRTKFPETWIWADVVAQ